MRQEKSVILFIETLLEKFYPLVGLGYDVDICFLSNNLREDWTDT